MRGTPDMARLRPGRRSPLAGEGGLVEAQRQTYALQPRIWAVTGGALRTAEGAQISTPLLLTTNEMFDAAEAERAAHEIRIPDRTLRVLVILVLGCAGLLGVG